MELLEMYVKGQKALADKGPVYDTQARKHPLLFKIV
jgi:hypothetical protein